MKNKNGNTGAEISRRRSLSLLGGAAATGVFTLVACKNDKPTGETGSSTTGTAPLDCNTQPDETSKNLRKTLQYKKEATDPAKHCSACAQFEAGKFGECGGCKLFTGPVRPNGGCLSFAPKEGGAAPATSG